MKKPFLSKKLVLALVVIGIVALVAALVACTPAETVAKTRVPPVYDTPPTDEYGVVLADQWAEIYPDQYGTYKDNLSNAPGAAKHNYLEMYPALATLYAGNAFSKGYNQAAAHLFSLDSVRATPRINEKSLQNCYTCKTPQFTNTINTQGIEGYSIPFADAPGYTEPISCFNCHANDPETLTVGNQFWINALGADVSKVPEASSVCGQCHNEYYFDPQTKATTNPYNGLKSMSAEASLAYYDSIAFKDWEYPVTLTPMLKAQHPEFETIYGGGTQSSMAAINYSCADCHMAPSTADDGTPFTSHMWQSPLKNADLVQGTCQQSGCHTDLNADVKGHQDAYLKRISEVSLSLEAMVKAFVGKVEAGALSDDQLAQMRTIHRSAQWYFDFTFVENSNGAHNFAVSSDNLDACEKLIAEGMAIVG